MKCVAGDYQRQRDSSSSSKQWQNAQLSPASQTSTTSLSSPLDALHLFVASINEPQPFSKNDHFVANPSLTSQPSLLQGSVHTIIPRRSTSLKPSNNPPQRSSHRSS